MKAQYDVERAEARSRQARLVSRIEYESAKLSLGRRRAAAERGRGEERSRRRAPPTPELTGKRRSRDKAQYDVERTQAVDRRAASCSRPPTGTGQHPREPRGPGGPFGGGGVEFREGDSRLGGASILEAARPVVDPPRAPARRIGSRAG
jgi:hypothetical protein